MRVESPYIGGSSGLSIFDYFPRIVAYIVGFDFLHKTMQTVLNESD